MNALIVEDTRLARKELKHLLASIVPAAPVGEAALAEEAGAQVAALKPDLLFLDLQMPGKNGFELLASLDHAPDVIISTAYDEYAVKGVDYNALDYLQK